MRHVLTGTPAQQLLGLLSGLLEGSAPDLQDIVYLRSALLRNVDIYTPLGLRDQIRDANLEAGPPTGG